MKLCVATWVCVTVILFGGSALGQQPPVVPPAQLKQLSEKKEPVPAPKHKLGPLEVSINWRTRAEGWNWFEGKTGNSDYGLWDSLLRVGIGQTGEHFDWLSQVSKFFNREQ